MPTPGMGMMGGGMRRMPWRGPPPRSFQRGTIAEWMKRLRRDPTSGRMTGFRLDQPSALEPISGGGWTSPRLGASPGASPFSTALEPRMGGGGWTSPSMGQVGPVPGVEFGGASNEQMAAWQEMIDSVHPEEAKRLESGKQLLLQSGTTPEQAAALRGVKGWQASPKVAADAARAAERRAVKGWQAVPKGATKAVSKVEQVTDDVIKTAVKTPAGRKWLITAGVSATVIAAALTPPSEEDEKKGLGTRLWEMTAGPALQAAIEGRPVGREYGRSMGRQLQAVGQLIRGAAAEPIRGLAAQLGIEGQGPAGVEAPTPEEVPPSPPAEPSAAPPQSDLEVALGRVGRGDLGTAESPLTLTGEVTDREKAYRELGGMPEQREAKHKAGMAEVEAERLMDMLSSGGERLTPETQQLLRDKIGMKLQLATKYGALARAREQSLEGELMAGTQLMAAVEKSRLVQEQMGNRQERVEITKDELRREALLRRNTASMLKQTYNTYITGNAKQRNSALLAIGNHLQLIKPDLDEDTAIAIAHEFVSLPPEVMEERLEELQGLLGKEE